MPVAQARYNEQSMGDFEGAHGNTRGRVCPSPTFNARALKGAKWSSTEEISGRGFDADLGGPKFWSPKHAPPSPTIERKDKDFKPIKFDSNSIQRDKKGHHRESHLSGSDKIAPNDSFAWKDKTLDKELKALKASGKHFDQESEIYNPRRDRERDDPSLGDSLG
eukprot:maker-scaffold150_size309978-snap-gene-2.16 protein:Tk09115 transcript:maker-scaffold150_size309978-snap-gene-2.16-mRNA-1 annotation:"conserved hypothetical protein"